jgi:hypothetical protein
MLQSPEVRRTTPRQEPAHDAADDTSQQRAVADVGLLQHRCLVQFREIDAAPRQEMHVPVLDAREQKIVRASSCAIDVRQHPVEPASHMASSCGMSRPSQRSDGRWTRP